MLRKIQENDVDYMYEWMHDKDVVQFLDKDFNNYTKQDCIKFINESTKIDNNLHYAITDTTDEYLGTVSLKNIDVNKNTAELAIVLRKCAMGKGYASKALTDIFKIGLKDFNIRTFYWYVNRNNVRAIKFYDKNGYKRINIPMNGINDEKYIWYIYTTE